MNDCPNADVRDLLPDLVNDRLDAPARQSVEAHVAGCADCRAELALLRDLRGSLRFTPSLDLEAINAAIPAYKAKARRSWVGWRAAAAITVLVAGGSSIALIGRGPSAPGPVEPPLVASVESVAVPPALVAAGNDAETTMEVAPQAPVRSEPVRKVTASTTDEGRELAMAAGSLTDLSDRELDALLRDIESLDALPTTAVDAAVASPLAPSVSGRRTP